MAIYFGNLDRELEDRQRVLREDAARQYRGSRDMMQSFTDLGTTVSTSIKDVAQAKLDQAKLKYNVRRNEEADEIRAEQHSQATTRNRELSLDSTLKNIGRFRKSSIEDYIGRLWFWRDPKAVRASYAERMKLFTADKDTLTAEERIRLYPNLFGTEALEKLKIYNLLLKQKKDGITTPDKDIQAALDKLPLTPMNFMNWAKDTGMYNTKMEGINPTKIPNAMQRAALIDYGYDIPDANELYKKASETATTASLTDPSETTSGVTTGDLLGGIDVTSSADVAESAAEIISSFTGSGLGSDGGVYIDDTTGESISLGGGGPVDSAATDTSTITGGEYEGGTVTIGGTDYSLTGGGEIDTSVGGVTAAEAAATEVAGGTTATEVETLAGQQLSEETSTAVEKVTAVNEAILRANKYHRDKMSQSPGYPGNLANSFTVAAKVVAPVVDTASSIIRERDKVKRDPSDKLYTLQGPERDRDPAFFPFMEASRGRKLGAYYGKLPNYSTWENVDPVEKAAILKHPATVAFGASPKSVAGLIKAEDNLAQIDEQISFINDKASQVSQAGEGTQVKWKQGQQKTDYLVQDSEEFFIPSVSSEISPGGGALSPAAQGAISNVKIQQAKDIAKQLPRLENQRKQLAERVRYAEADVQASQSDKSKMTYRGSLASDFGVSNDPSLATIRPQDTSSYQEVTNQPPRDAGTQAAIEDNYAEDTQKEIISGIIDREGYGLRNAGYSYYDGPDPDEEGYYKKDGGESLTLAGGNNIWGTINTMPTKERKEAIKEITDGLFGEGNSGERPYITRGELLRFLNMPKKDHKKVYDSAVNRGRLRLTIGQRNFLTGFSYRNHLERMVKHHPYLSGIAQYPKAMQVFLMDNAFNMGPRWLKDKFTKTEKHLRRWVKTRLPSDLEKMKKEYKNSDHYRETTRAKDLVAMISK